MPKLLPWEQLQEDVRLAFESLGFGPAKVSRGSGAVKGNGDVQNEIFMAECKLRTTEGFTIHQDIVNKIRKEAALVGKIPLLVNRNKNKQTLVTLTLEDFIRVAGPPKESYGRDNSSGSDLYH